MTRKAWPADKSHCAAFWLFALEAYSNICVPPGWRSSFQTDTCSSTRCLVCLVFFFFLHKRQSWHRIHLPLIFTLVAEVDHCDVASRWWSGFDPTVDLELHRVEFACSFRVHLGSLQPPATAQRHALGRAVTWLLHTGLRCDCECEWGFVSVCWLWWAGNLSRLTPCSRDRWLSGEKWSKIYGWMSSRDLALATSRFWREKKHFWINEMQIIQTWPGQSSLMRRSRRGKRKNSCCWIWQSVRVQGSHQGEGKCGRITSGMSFLWESEEALAGSI